MNPYSQFVSNFSHLIKDGQSLPLGTCPCPPAPPIPMSAPRVLLFSPHPDDECLTGGLPLRLLRQSRMRVTNVAVTLGSDDERRQARREELTAACDFIGFDLIDALAEHNSGKIHPETAATDPGAWRASVKQIAEILEEQTPEILFLPHLDDFNTTHIGAHHLVINALQWLGNVSCWTVETEFWHPMKDPNLLVESSQQQVADLLAALSFHVGELERNPYHLSAPAWMMDNVRRGSELLGGQGCAAANFLFGTLYRIRRWEKSRFEEAQPANRILPAHTDPSALFN